MDNLKLKSTKEFELIEGNAKDAPVKDIHWQGRDIETEAVPLKDKGEGNPIILRKFDYELPPQGKRPTKEELLAFHEKKILPFLWKDGLEIVQEPKLHFGKGRKFTIFVPCQARRGQIYSYKDTPQKLDKILNDKRRNTK